MSLVCVAEGVLATVVFALAFGLAPFELASLALVVAVLAAFWLALVLIVVVLAAVLVVVVLAIVLVVVVLAIVAGCGG